MGGESTSSGGGQSLAAAEEVRRANSRTAEVSSGGKEQRSVEYA